MSVDSFAFEPGRGHGHGHGMAMAMAMAMAMTLPNICRKNMEKQLVKIRGLVKCHRHGWIRTEILCENFTAFMATIGKPFNTTLKSWMGPGRDPD